MMLAAAAVEFHDGGNTIWVHSPDGSTMLRIKTMGRIHVDKCTVSPVSHADMIVREDINICIGADAKPLEP